MNIMTASAQWASRPRDQRFENLSDLRAAVATRRNLSRSVDLDLTRINAEQKGETFVLNSGITPCEPSHWALGQFASLLHAPSSYLRTLSPRLLVDCVNEGIAKQPREDVKFMTIAREEGPNVLQAVTSTTYGRIWDADVVDAVGRIVERSGGKFHNPLAYDMATGAARPSGLYASDRDVFAFMIDGGSLLEVGPRAQLNRGFIVWNSEVGARTFGLTTFLFNVVCGNHIIWGAQDVNQLVIRHTAGGPARFDSLAAPALLEFANRSAAAETETIRKAMDRLLPKEDEDLIKLVSPFKITRSDLREAASAARKEEGDFRTLWHLVQGLTAYARGFDYVDARMDLERRAGSLLKLVA